MSASSTSTGDLARMDELANSMNVSMQEFKQWSESLSDQIKKRDEESRKRARELQEAETALEKEKEEVMREKDALGGQREALKEAQDRLSEEQASCQNLKERLASQQLKESDLARAIRFQASQFTSPSKDVDPEIVGKIVDMIASNPAPYLFWMASHYGSEKDIFENGQAIFNNRDAAHAAQHLLIEDTLQQLSSRFLVVTTVQLRTTQIAMLILQGLLYLRGLISPSLSDSLMQVIGQYTQQLEDGFVLQSITRLAQDPSVNSWKSELEAESGTHVLDKSNSDLAAGLCLVVDLSDVFILVDTRAQVVVYVFDKEDIESVDIYEESVTFLRLRSSISISQELQNLLLTSQLRFVAGVAWRRLFPLMQHRD